MSTWKQLEAMARRDGMSLFPPPSRKKLNGSVSICEAAPLPLVCIIVELNGKDADTVARGACEGALRALKGIRR